MSADQKKIVEEGAKAFADYEWQLAENSYEDDKKFLMGKGMKFVMPDANFSKQMEAAVQPIYTEYYAKYPWAKDLVAKVKATN